MKGLLIRHDARVPYVLFSLTLIVSAIVSWLDVKIQHVPIRVLQLGIGGAFILQLFGGDWLKTLLAIAIGFALLFLPSHLSRGRLFGEGDAWVGAFMGAVLGFPLLWVGLYLSILFGGVVAIVLLCFGWKRKDHVPYAPILCFGTLMSLIWGQSLIQFLSDRFFA